MRTPIYGVILAGGSGRRMGHQNKGLLELKGIPLFEHVRTRLVPQVTHLLISANADQDAYGVFGDEVVADSASYRGLGPLAGIEACLKRIPHGARVQIVSCDCPRLPLDLVAKLSEAAVHCGVTAVYPQTPMRAHYSFMQLTADDAMVVRQQLEVGQLRLRDLLVKLNAKTVAFEDEAAFVNCNTLADFAALA